MAFAGLCAAKSSWSLSAFASESPSFLVEGDNKCVLSAAGEAPHLEAEPSLAAEDGFSSAPGEPEGAAQQPPAVDDQLYHREASTPVDPLQAPSVEPLQAVLPAELQQVASCSILLRHPCLTVACFGCRMGLFLLSKTMT